MGGNMDKLKKIHDALIFDMDGVLIDTTFSYPMVIRMAVQWGWRYLLGNDVNCTAFSYGHFYISKTHPAFNDDYDIAWILLSLAASKGIRSLKKAFPTPKQWEEILQNFNGDDPSLLLSDNFNNIVPRSSVRQLCEEIYFGREEYISLQSKEPKWYKGKGLWRRERALIDVHWKDLPLPVCIFTGRSRKECLLGLKLLGWEDLPKERIFTLEDGMPKPSPEGLEVLSARVGAKNPIFFGDTSSDLESAKRFGRGKFVYVGKTPKDLPLVFVDAQKALSELGFID